RAGASFEEKPVGRYEARHLRDRLALIAKAPSDELRGMAAKIAEKLDAVASVHEANDGPRGVIHGDLFRDNVLWNRDHISAVLDFESACEGSFAYDLMVTALAWCYGERLDLELVRAMFAGYESVRPL